MATAYCTYDLRIAQFGCAGQSDGSGEVGDPDVAPRATPCKLCRELLQVCCNEIYSRYVVPKASVDLFK